MANQPVLDLARVDDVIVVEHQHDIFRDSTDVDKSGQDRLAQRLGRQEE